MRAPVSILAMWVGLGVAMAQTTPPDQQTPPQTQAAPQKADKPQSDTKADAKAKAMDSTKLPEMMTKTYKGTLVDMSCAAHASSSSAPAPTADSSSANRSAGDSGNCAVTANSTSLGLKTADGKTLRFDLVGNQRAQDALKNEKGWGKDLAAGKQIHAKVLGALNGDKLIVSSIQ
jgi:uncharacterized protein involved in copper resistance